MIKPISLTVVAVLLALFSVSALLGSAESHPEPQRQEPSQVVKASRPEVGEGYRVDRQYTGTVAARRTSVLSFLRAGRVEQILVDEGDQVARGQKLAVLDTRALFAQEAQLRARLQRAQARYDELSEGPRLEPRLGAQAQVRRLQAELELAEQKLERRRLLFQEGAIPRENLDEWESQVKVARESLDAALQDSLELDNGTRPEILAQAAAEIREVEASLQSMEVQFQDSSLLAPYSGRIAQRMSDEGTVVSPGTPVFGFDEDGPGEALIDLPADLTPPQEVDLLLEGREVRGTLIAQQPRVDQASFTQTARYLIPYTLPGTPVVLTLERYVSEPGLWIPLGALKAGDNGLWQCYTVNEEGQVDTQHLEVLYREPGRALVRGTLTVDDRVIVEGAQNVVPGQSVAVDLR